MYKETSIHDLQTQTSAALSSTYNLASLKITLNGSTVDLGNLLMALETIHERLLRIEETGIMERLLKLEVMK